MKINSEQYVQNKAMRRLKTIKAKIHRCGTQKRTACNNYYNPIHVHARELNRQKTITKLREERQQLKHTKEKQKEICELEGLVANQTLLMTQHKRSKNSNCACTCSTKVVEAVTNSTLSFYINKSVLKLTEESTTEKLTKTL